MHVSPLDWAIIAAYLLFALGIGIYYSRRASASAEEYYLAGRTLPWWVVGTSMVATTFAADTPLAITEMVRTKGVWENWFWWNWLLYGLLAVFLFARLWRRANVLTENELIELRYSGRPAACLRMFKAGYFALLYNFIVLGWVLKGMASVLTVMFVDQTSTLFTLGGVEFGGQDVILWSLVAIAVIYSLLSGFWGVVVTDLVQFLIAMVGAILLAVLAVNHVGGMGSLKEQLDMTLADRFATQQARLDAEQDATAKARLKAELATMPKSAADAIRVIPPLPRDVPLFSTEFVTSKFFEFFVLITVMWWSNHATDGGGYLIQRTMAAKDERHAAAANLWFNFANFALRTWPWVVVALVSIVVIPDLRSHELGEKAGYPLVMQLVLGPGLRGLLIVSFLAAFMSTIDTHLNWGSSYIVHDIYRRFLVRDASERHYVNAGRWVTVVLMVLAAILSLNMGSIEKAWKFVMAMGGGIGLVLILRWFWWRINAWTEITALAVSVAMTLMFELIAAVQVMQRGEQYIFFETDPVILGCPFAFHLQLLVIVAVSIVSWLLATFLTRPEPEVTRRAFYERVQPGGWWGSVQVTTEHTLQPVTRNFGANFVAGAALIWGGMFFIGNVIFGQWTTGCLNFIAAAAGFAWIWLTTISKR